MGRLTVLALLGVILCGGYVNGQCKKRDIIALIELTPGDRYAGTYVSSFVASLKRLFDPKPECTRLGVMVVWTQVEKVIDLKCDYRGCFANGQQEIRRISRLSGRTQTAFNKKILADGLQAVASQFVTKGRENVDKLLLLVLTNAPTAGAPKTQDEIKDMLDLRVSILVVAVAGGRKEKLGEIASPSHYQVDFKSMSQLVANGHSEIAQLISLPLGQPVGFAAVEDPNTNRLLKEDAASTCENIVDIAFIVDSSGSVKKYYNQEKFFVKRIATRFNIIETGTHGGVILFSSHGYVKTHIRFKDFLTTEAFNEAVQNLPFYGYQTRIDHALELAHRELYTVAGGNRPNVKKLLFLITDGRQNPDSINGVRLDPAKEAEKLHLSNVQIYAVGIGSKVNVSELEAITQDPTKVYTAKDFEELTSTEFVTKVSKQLCLAASLEENTTTINFDKPKGNCTTDCKCGGCGCCGSKPVYVNIFQGGNSKNYVNQGQTVVQSGNSNQAGPKDESGPLTGGQVKEMSNKEILAYVKKLVPYYDSLNGSLKELLQRTIVNRRKKRAVKG
ncbi:vitrin-like isoform X2 [Rhopilema esculentum]|uniref:vitrin-like isoform X2 n=1 Tax=Rhopilema esculentum TaxID=499914 RepID=UPI0031DEF80C